MVFVKQFKEYPEDTFCCKTNKNYRKNPKYWDRQAFTNSVDPDQTPQKAASDQGLQFAIHTAII